MKKKSILIAGRHATSICLEEEFFAALYEIAGTKKMSLNQLVTQIDSDRNNANLCSALRVYALKYYQQKSIAPK